MGAKLRELEQITVKCYTRDVPGADPRPEVEAEQAHAFNLPNPYFAKQAAE